MGYRHPPLDNTLGRIFGVGMFGRVAEDFLSNGQKLSRQASFYQVCHLLLVTFWRATWMPDEATSNCMISLGSGFVLYLGCGHIAALGQATLENHLADMEINLRQGNRSDCGILDADC
jgi:hypothetical protein